MRALIAADLHMSAYSQEATISYQGLEVSEKLVSIVKAVKEMIEYAKKKEITKVILAGDTFHTKSIIHSLAQSLFLDIIRENKNIQFIIIDGNHDMSSKSGIGVSALKCCDNEPNVFMLHESKEIDNIWFVPWNPKTMNQDIIKGSPNKVPYLISHLGLNEGKMNSGISIVSDIGLKDLTKYKLAILGHYHANQEVGNVIYVGSLIQMDWGEKHEVKRFLDFNSDTGEFISIPSSGYKKYFELEIKKDNVKEVLEEAKKLQEQGDFVRLRKLEEVDTVDIQDTYHIIDDTENDITNRGVSTTMSMEQKLLKYLEIKKIRPEDYEMYKSIGMDIVSSI